MEESDTTSNDKKPPLSKPAKHVLVIGTTNRFIFFYLLQQDITYLVSIDSREFGEFFKTKKYVLIGQECGKLEHVFVVIKNLAAKIP
jgi:hypothetical protein